MTIISSYKNYQFGGEAPLSEQQMNQLVACFKTPASASRDALSGRAAVSTIDLKNIGRTVVRSYTRGGIVRYFNKNSYLKLSDYRCRSEFKLLQHLETIGVSVPHPVAFAYQCVFGPYLYHAWLITKEIAEAYTLAQLCVAAPGRIQKVVDQLSRQISILIENRIHHVDLHPGNVLVNSANQVFIIDFDKARVDQKNHRRLRKKYIERWQRAVLKHHLPNVLNDIAIP